MPFPNPDGRPTKYEPAYCDQVIELARDGFSLTAFAGAIGVSRSTINEWIAAHPDFAEAVEISKAGRAYTFEGDLIALSNGTRSGNPVATIFALKNVAPQEFADKRDVEHSGKDGAAIPVSVAIEFVSPG